jgi:hypothetical protein
LGAALARSGSPARVSKRALEQGLTKLRGAIERQGSEHAIGSEVVLIDLRAEKARA